MCFGKDLIVTFGLNSGCSLDQSRAVKYLQPQPKSRGDMLSIHKMPSKSSVLNKTQVLDQGRYPRWVHTFSLTSICLSSLVKSRVGGFPASQRDFVKVQSLIFVNHPVIVVSEVIGKPVKKWKNSVFKARCEHCKKWDTVPCRAVTSKWNF